MVVERNSWIALENTLVVVVSVDALCNPEPLIKSPHFFYFFLPSS
jgi:hypothetical protein